MARSFSALFVRITPAFFVRFHNFGSIGVIFHKTTESRCNNALHDVVFIHPVELAHDLGHERSNLLLVNLGTLQFINHIIELFCTDVLGRRQMSAHKLLAYFFFYAANLAFFAQMHNTY